MSEQEKVCSSSEYVDLSDPRVRKKLKDPRVTEKVSGGREIGFHHEPRIPNIPVNTKCWNMIPGDFAELTVKDIPLVGIVYEAAEHHLDANILVDGKGYYGGRGDWGGAYILSGYSPSGDGYGRVHWIAIPRGRHTLRVEVTKHYNQMCDVMGIWADHFCLSGFLLMDSMNFPPPTYGSWCLKKTEREEKYMMLTSETLYHKKTGAAEELTSDHLFITIPAWEARKRGEPYTESSYKYLGPYTGVMKTVIPPKGYLCLMDLYGQGSLDYIAVKADSSFRLDIIDGMARMDSFSTWLGQIYVPPHDEDKDLFEGIMTFKIEKGKYLGKSSERINFGNRLFVRLFNPDTEPHNLLGVYMRGSLRLM